ncbi:MAG: chromate transporter, partial [Pseudoflavonifractor sp.]
VLGGIAATLGLVFPSVVIIAVIALCLHSFADLPAVRHAFAGIRACVCALILTSVIRLAKNAVVDVPSAVIFAAALVLAAFVGLSPVLVVLGGGICGLAVRQIKRWNA